MTADEPRNARGDTVPEAKMRLLMGHMDAIGQIGGYVAVTALVRLAKYAGTVEQQVRDRMEGTGDES